MYASKSIFRLSLLVSTLAYIAIAFFTPREDIYTFLALYFTLFGIYIFCLGKGYQSSRLIPLLVFGIFVRLLFLYSDPLLSNDYYRFIWDGRLFLNGLNPYLRTPVELMKDSQGIFPDMPLLFEGMGSLSQNNYTCYPPLNQLVFAGTTCIFPDSIMANIFSMKLLILLAEIGTMYFGMKILQLLKLNIHNILIYSLNPFIIIELTGNIHWEGLMIFFIIASVYFLLKEKMILAGLFMAMAISMKLIPIIFLPFLLRKIPLSKLLVFYVSTLFFFVCSYVPFLRGEAFNNIIDTVSLYFDHFEFNASLFYLIREIGYAFKGWNIIRTAGPVLTIISGCIIWYFALKKENVTWKNVLKNMLFALTIYYLMATTVHPWYISTLLVLSVFTGHRYVVLWSGLIMLSYFAYSLDGFKENLYLTMFEYLLVYALFFYEIFKGPSGSKKYIGQIVN